MYKYHVVIGTLGGISEELYGSFDKDDCIYELGAERDSWKGEGYKGLRVASRLTSEAPDPAVYS